MGLAESSNDKENCGVRAKLQNAWENLKASLWFIPTLLVIGAIAASFLLLQVDIWLQRGQYAFQFWLFSGTADSAQTLLGVIAGSLITVISIAYSVTIVAIQQMSAQFSPRVLRTFTSDRGSQIVLGAYIATFVYALLVTRQIRNPSAGEGFVPVLSVTVALILSLVCLGLLIYFIHHISQLLQVSIVIDLVHDELIEEIGRLYPDQIGAPTDRGEELPAMIDRAETAGTIRAIESVAAGHLRSIDTDTLIGASDGRTPWLYVRPQVGEYIPHGSVLIELPEEAEIDMAGLEQLRDAFVIDTERTLHQDPLFGIRQLVDIALKALSPAINDPTTAEYSLAHLGDVLGRLANCDFPSEQRIGPSGRTQYIISRPSWDEFVDLAFGQIRRQASDNVHVTGYLLHVLLKLARALAPGPRAEAVMREVDGIRYVLDRGHLSPADIDMLRAQCDEVEEALRRDIEVPAALDA